MALWLTFHTTHRMTIEDVGDEGDVSAEECEEDPEVVAVKPRPVRKLRVAREGVEQTRGEHTELERRAKKSYLTIFVARRLGEPRT